MTFAIFDSHAVISSRNSVFFGFTGFSKEFFHTLHLGFELYHNSRFKKTGLNSERMTFRECANAIIRFRRREHDVAMLHTRKFWETTQRAARHNVVLQQQLRETEEAFQHEARFATHSHVSLLDAYKRLAQIEKLVVRALKDIENAKKRRYFGRMPEALLTQYHDYLIQQWAILKQEREDIVIHMLNRLIQAARDPFLENADTLPDITNDLKEKGIIRKAYRIPMLSDNKLTPELFRRFHRILKAQPSGEVSRIMRELPWFENHPNIATRIGVNHLIPESAKSPKFLYYFHNLRFHWFDDYYEHAKIDSTLHYLRMSKVAIASTAESLTHRMLALYSAENALQSQFVRIEQARKESLSGLRKYFSRLTINFLVRIEDFFKLQKFQLLCEKIDLLGCISTAPIENLKEIQLYAFIRSFPARISPPQRKQFEEHKARIKERVSPHYETHLKRYFAEWASFASLQNLTPEQLQEAHARAEKDEAVLMTFLPERWTFRIEKIRELRLTNQFKAAEVWAGIGLIELFRERPALLQKQIQDELQYLSESLEEYIKDYVEEFDYADQKSYLLHLITLLDKEGVTETTDSHQLSPTDKTFLESFPEINFFVNVTLKIKSAEKLSANLNNISDIKTYLDDIYRFIKRQEGHYLNKNKAKFATLFCREATLAQKNLSIYPIRRIIR